ncbi:MAG: MBL fold metallo-hydrolase [Rhodospirillaceae bacterium]
MKITILGCGAAAGVPSVSTGWGRCDPANPKNRRRRASILVQEGLVEEGGKTLLVDTSPDLRDQLLDAGVRHLDGVLFTHAHADHIHGLDELREVNRAMRAPIPVYGTAETLEVLEHRFAYAFQGIPEGKPIFRPWLLANVIEPDQAFSVAGIPVRAFLQDHGYGTTTIGYRFADAAYSTDLIDLPAASREIVRGAKLWIIGALQEAPHPTHASLPQVLAWVKDLALARAVITHMSNDLDYDALVSHALPVGVTPAFDGFSIDI